jgi:hypothetical protein
MAGLGRHWLGKDWLGLQCCGSNKSFENLNL